MVLVGKPGRTVKTRLNEVTGIEEEAAEPNFTRAILKIALELRKPNAPGYDAVVAQAIQSLHLDPVRFRRYLGENGARNMSLLLATAKAFGV